MINAGAIVTASLFKNQLSLPDRFDFVSIEVLSLEIKILYALFTPNESECKFFL